MNKLFETVLKEGTGKGYGDWDEDFDQPEVDMLQDWLADQYESDVIDDLVMAIKKEGLTGKYENYSGERRNGAYLSRNVKRWGIPKDIEDDEEGFNLIISDQFDYLNDQLEDNTYGNLHLEVEGRMGGHWVFAGDIIHVIEGLFDYTFKGDEPIFTPNEFFKEFDKNWTAIGENNMKGNIDE